MTIPGVLKDLLVQGVTDVLISGPGHCQIDRGNGLESVAIDLGSDSDLRKMAIDLALEAGARADIAKPISDFAIANYRFQVVLPFGVSGQTLISIRRHPAVQVTLDHLVEAKMLNDQTKAVLSSALTDGKTILVTGPTGSGKTTLLSALIQRSANRVICIEQTPELTPQFPALSLTEREANQEGMGRIDSVDLLGHALRMRPDRLVVGEVRGKEFAALMLAINNGHSAMATLHAQSLESLPRRLSILGHLAGLEERTTAELCRAIDLVVHLEHGPIRRVSALAGIRVEHGRLEVIPIAL